jgi:hypothetical protein
MASGDVTTGGSSTTPNSKLVGQTSDMLLKGLQGAYKGGVDVYGKPLYTDPSKATEQAWWRGGQLGNALNSSGGYGTGQKAAQDSLGGVFGGYGGIADNNGLTGAQGRAMTGNAGLGAKYGALGTAYDPKSAAYKTLRQGVVDDTLSNLGSQFTSSGRFGGGSYIDTASEGLGDALAGLDYNNMQNNINNQYRSLDSQRGIFGDTFGMGQQGVGNQLAGLAGQGATAGQQFGMGQTALGNRQGAIGLLGQIGASQDADSLARRMADADLFDRTQNADWNTLGRATSILGGNQTASGSTTNNSVPWWAALLGGAATGASIFG